MKKRLAEVVLREDSIRRLQRGQKVTIRFEDLDIDLRFDPLARIGGSGSIEDMIADALHLRKHA